MAVAPLYRNTRPNFYSDKSCDSTEIGSIITTFKSTDNSYDHVNVPMTSYSVSTGNANTQNNPEYQYPGYLYCDGTEYNISDFPALFQVIGTEYGGSVRKGFNITNGGSGYASGTVITFSAAPSGGETIEATVNIGANGEITGIFATNLGIGYLTEPTYTLSSVGTGSGFTMEINLGVAGGVEDVAPSNVWTHYGEDRDLGTFKIPDLRAKKIVGYGNVYGPGSPTIGNTTLGAGAGKTGGNWYLDKASQKGYFSLGTIVTTGYEKITDSVNTTITGQQTVKVTIDNRRLQGAPQHNHNVYHTAPNTSITWTSSFSGDRYLANYTSGNARLDGFYPVGGVQFEHKHGLLKQPLTDATVATYDIYDWKMGSAGTGDIKVTAADGTLSNYYYASGSVGAGTYETVTYTPTTVFKTLSTNSVIGGREVRTGGKAIIDYSTEYEYTSAQTNTGITFPATWEVMEVLMYGGGGSGSNGNDKGNNGSATIFNVGSDLNIIANGGTGGGNGSGDDPWDGGAKGESDITGDAMNSLNTLWDIGMDGGTGSQGPFPASTYASNPQQAGAGGDVSGHDANNWGDGSDGLHTFTSALGSEQTLSTSGSASWSISPVIGVWDYIKFTIAGGKGSGSELYPGPSGQSSGAGRAGSVIDVEITNPTGAYSVQAYAGAAGGVRAGGAGGSNADGGNGGNGATDDGGGGGGGSYIKVGSDIWAGAGGGGGGGGVQQGGSPANGGSGRPRSQMPVGGGVNVHTSDNYYGSNGYALFTDSGSHGGNYGCVGGGGGGGGAGIYSSNFSGGGGSSGGGGGPSDGGGGGTGGWSGHGGGDGGFQGMSAYRADKMTGINSSVSNNGGGYVTVRYREDASAWSPGGGGGGSGNHINTLIDRWMIPTASNATITIGSGGSAVSGGTNGGGGYAKIGFGVVVGWEGGEVSTTVGDIIIEASSGVNIYSTGTGIGDGGGFRLPTHQANEVEFFGGGGGSGAAASTSIAGGVTSGITLDSPGLGYTDNPTVRIKHGAGSGAFATATASTAVPPYSVATVQLSSLATPTAYVRYVKFAGFGEDRYCIIKAHDCQNVKKFTVKACRGNGKNGGNLPEGGDELKLYYNTNGSLDSWDFLNVLVPIPTSAEVQSDYDGSGTGNEATKWYWYSADLPEDAKKAGTQFKIAQSRNPAGAGNDNDQDSDHYGICDFIYEYDLVTELQFVPAAGQMPTSVDELTYQVEGSPTAFYTSGAVGNDATFTLTAQQPLVPAAAIDPDIDVPLVEPYHLCKYLIKAF